MKLLLILVGCLALLGVSVANQLPARYDDFKVYRVIVKDAQQLSKFRKLGDNLPLCYLNELKGAGHCNDVVIDPANQEKLETQLRFLELDFSCIIKDLQSVLEAEMDWTKYHNLTVIYNWLQKLTIDNPSLVTPYVIGYTYEGRPIRAVKISAKPGNKAIFIESNTLALTWLTSATTTCFLNNLLKSSDEEIKNLRENYDWIFVPVLNPDGFEYTHNVERLWRKNRRPTGHFKDLEPCYGIDLNRNFDYNWGVSGYKVNVPCDQWYCGSKPESESEIIGLKNFVNSFGNDYIHMYLALHANGHNVKLPYGHTTTEFPSNYDQMMRIATAFADGARVKYGADYKCGASGLISNLVSGTSKDWAYGVKNIPFTASIDLRTNKYAPSGYLLPPSQILEVCAEFTDGLVSMLGTAKNEGLFH